MKFDNFEQAYYHLLNNDINSVTIVNTRQNLVYRDNLNIKSFIGEFICNMQGKNDLEMLKYYTPAYAKITDDNDTVNGMIGNRIFRYDCMFDIYQNDNNEFTCEHIVSDQFEDCIKKLKENNIYNMPIYNKVFDDNSKHPSEIENILFYIDNNILHTTVNTNVFDVYIRFPYLAFFISNLMSILCSKLDLKLGTTTINFGYMIISNVSQPLYIYNNDEILENNIISDTDIFDKVFAIELMSRIQGTITTLDIYEKLLDEIDNRYWQSIAALLIKLNTNYDVDSYISNEFYKLIK